MQRLKLHRADIVKDIWITLNQREVDVVMLGSELWFRGQRSSREFILLNENLLSSWRNLSVSKKKMFLLNAAEWI